MYNMDAAVAGGDVEMVRLLLRAGDPADVPLWVGGFTPAMLAVSSGKADVLEVLLKAGATNRGDMRALLHTALTVQDTKVAVVKMLLDAGAPVDDRPGGAEATLANARILERQSVQRQLAEMCEFGSGVAIKEFIVREGAVPDGRAVRQAIYGDNGEAITALIAAGADPNCLHDDDEEPPLYWAVLRSADKAVKVLLKAGADPNRPFSNGTTPLLMAVRDNSVFVAKKLLSKGALVTEEVEAAARSAPDKWASTLVLTGKMY